MSKIRLGKKQCQHLKNRELPLRSMHHFQPVSFGDAIQLQAKGLEFCSSLDAQDLLILFYLYNHPSTRVVGRGR